ncbi:hypothetical protein FRC07_002273 [Ceratobasidium sp. 392]|nr:hypothetical protein FRC07_002273 [Ceratobasidium sp. 392]
MSTLPTQTARLSQTVEVKVYGISFDLPASELVLMRDELQEGITPGSFIRVLDCFAIFTNGQPVPLNAARYTGQKWSGITAVGAVAALAGSGKYFAQCGWFHRLKWLWLSLPVVQEVRVKQDARFRDGEPTMWLKTPAGDYALLSPHRDFMKQWGVTICRFGNVARASVFRRWPPDAPRPPWWPENDMEPFPAPGEPSSHPNQAVAPSEPNNRANIPGNESNERLRISGSQEEPIGSDSEPSSDEIEDAGMEARIATRSRLALPWKSCVYDSMAHRKAKKLHT